MSRSWICWAILLSSCSGQPSADSAEQSLAEDPPAFEPPVLINAESPVNYPPDLFQQQVEGTVVLRLYVDAQGRVVPESTRIAQESGYPGLDSAALRGVQLMRFAPARRNGQPVGTAFLQPIQFRQPNRAEGGGER